MTHTISPETRMAGKRGAGKRVTRLAAVLALAVGGGSIAVALDGAAQAEEQATVKDAGIQVASPSAPAAPESSAAAPSDAKPATPEAVAAPSDAKPATPGPVAAPSDAKPATPEAVAAPSNEQPATPEPVAAPSDAKPGVPEPAVAPSEPKPAAPAPAAVPSEPKPAASEQAAATPSPSDQLLSSIRARLERAPAAADKESLAALRAFYAKSDAAPLWISAGAFNERAKTALKAFADADDWGLEAKAFDAPAAPSSDPEQLADAEIKLGLTALKYARFASGGRIDPGKLSKYIDVNPPVAEPGAVLAALAGSSDGYGVLTGFHPKHPQFVALRAALINARAPSAVETKPEPAAEPVVKISNGPLLKTGSKHEQVALLRQRLAVPAANPEQERVFDAKLADAVKAFQRESGLKASGSVNNATRHALNGEGSETKTAKHDPRKEIERLVLNMERWRWLPADLGQMYVWDNIPEFMTRVEKERRTIHQEKIIVGKTNTQTPIFSARMQYVVFHPEWGVPDSIKVKEILPYLRRPAYDGFLGFGGSVSDTRVLQRHNLRVSMNGRPVDASQVDWNAVDIRRYQFVQPSGGQNVLGVVKFRFPNKHDVYMHDTPQRELFSAKTRTFSHGCMRVHNPQKLAEVILGEDQGMSPGEVANLIARGGGSTEITLKKQIPVHVTYMTAVADESGKVQTFSDIYGHDARLALALSGKKTEFYDPPDVAEQPEALARQARAKRKTPPPTQIGPANFLSALFGN